MNNKNIQSNKSALLRVREGASLTSLRNTVTRRFAHAAVLVALPMQAEAGGQVAQPQETTTFEDLWSHATFYKDDSNPLLQEFKLRGRYQGQYWDTDADQGSQSDWEDRRSRLGFDAKLFDKQLEVRADFQSSNGFDDLYDGLVDAYLRWKPRKDLSITVGKTKPLIGHYDWVQSSNEQPTFERSQIFNQLNVNRATAITVEGSYDAFTWQAGVYANDTPANTGGSGAWGDGEFGDLDGGTSFSLGAGYDFKESLGSDKAEVRIDWLHSERTAGDLFMGRYDDLVSTTLWWEQGPAALVVEAFHGSGGSGPDSNVLGFFVQSMYDVVPKRLQLLARYSFARSTGDSGVIAQRRYEGSVAANGARGDSYHSIYAGAQYFIHGDKLKLMAGAEYAQLHGAPADAYDGLTVLSGIRFSF